MTPNDAIKLEARLTVIELMVGFLLKAYFALANAAPAQVTGVRPGRGGVPMPPRPTKATTMTDPITRSDRAHSPSTPIPIRRNIVSAKAGSSPNDGPGRAYLAIQRLDEAEAFPDDYDVVSCRAPQDHPLRRPWPQPHRHDAAGPPTFQISESVVP